MYTEGFEQWFKINKNLTAPLTEFHHASTEIFRRLTQQNLDMLSENLSRAADQTKRFSNIKKPEDLLSLQKDCLNENVSASIENVQKLVHSTIENMEVFTKLFGTTVVETNKNVEREREKHSSR